MKIIALLDNSIIAGGGFNQALNAIIQMKRICKNRFDFSVVTTFKENIPILKSFGIPAILKKRTFWDKLFSRLILMNFFKIIQDQFNPKWLYPMEKRLIKLGADLIYFVTPCAIIPNPRALNFIYTVWDHAHRDSPEFPEVRQYGIFQDREWIYERILPPAFLILTDSQVLADTIMNRYGIDRNRLLPMPFAPSPILNTKLSLGPDEILEKYNLKKGYFFYPAQFWPHKNHIRILEALIILRKEGKMPMVVFVGGDRGALRTVEKFIKENTLQNQVRLLGFVPSDEMQGFYEGCCAVVMPTYFGPTNIPPLEAWVIGKPLIYSVYFLEQAHDAALLIDPDKADDIAKAMQSCLDDNISKKLIKFGQERLLEIQKDREQAENELYAKLIQFESRLNCWKD